MEYYHLTTPQQNIWNLQKYYEDTAIGNQCGAVFYKEKRDNFLMQQAIYQFIQGQSGIRLRFLEKNEPVSFISCEEPEEISVITFSSVDEFDSYAKEFAKEPLGLTDRAMYRFVIFEVEGKSGILAVLSHLISDAWTFSLMANQVDAAYRNLADGAENTLLEADYTEYIQTEKEYFASARYEKDRKYWEEKYAVRPEKSMIKIYSAGEKSIKAERFTKNLPLDLEHGLRNYCKTHSVTPAVLFEAALIIYLSRINPENNTVTIGVPVLNRSNVREKKTAGMFVSTMPLTTTVREDMAVTELIKQITKEHMDIFRHQKYPYSEILKSLRESQNFTGNLYDVMISYQNAVTLTDADTKWYSNGYSEVPFVIHIDNRDGRSSHTINADYQTDIFQDEREAADVISRLEYILCQIIEDKIKLIKEIKIVPQSELKKILEEFNDTYVDYPREKCVHELFTEQAARTPDRTALVFEDRKFTYRELDEMSNSLAHFLREKGVKPNDVVPIIAKRSWHVVAAMLGVLKAGGAYMPVSPEFPPERIRYMFETADAKLVMTYGYCMDKDNPAICGTGIETVALEDADYSADTYPVRNRNETEDLCYIIFTSGSTGQPKGCVLSHKGIVNFCVNNNIVPYAEKLDHKTAISVNAISSDFFVAETLLPLLHGWTVVLAGEEESISKNLFKKLVIENNVNIIETTPTRLKIYSKDEKENGYLQQIQLIVSCGEELSESLLRSLKTVSPAKIYNTFGPSECSVWNTDGDFSTDITIGRPIANTQIYILDKDMRPVPAGVAGELCIAGDGVGKGYLNRPELTAEKFVPNPFATEENRHGKVMYRTGDLARWREDGEIEYLGRIDTQVKIRGLRIELGEIESVMGGFPGIRLTAAAAQKDDNGRQYLAGYYTAEGGIDEKELRKYLSSKLPKYMVPNYFVRLDTMPMTASGKTDRKSLPLPDFTVRTGDYVEPETDTEVKLCQLLETLLNVEKIGAEDDFFEAGGDSLTVMEYAAKAHDMGIEFSIQNVFDYPTVRKLCSFLSIGTEEKVSYEISDFDKYREIFNKNVADDSAVFEKNPLGSILLTGATGFLGAHVLDRLMQEESGRIYCLVRGSETCSGQERLRRTLKYYFGNKYESEYGRRIIPVEGDIEREGISDNMPSGVHTVIHTAASVKHFGSYDYFHKVNTEGTQHVIDYTKAAGARLIHISTLSVSGNSMADDFTVYRSEEEKFFYETSFYIGQPLDNVYIHSKFEAEKRVYDAMLGGLPAVVIRVGNLTNRASDYKFQPNYRENAFLTRFKSILEFGLFPDYLMKLYSEFSPVDKTAEGIVKIAQYAAEQTVFHLNSSKVIYFERFLEVVRELGIAMKVVDGASFNKELQKTIKDSETEYIFEAFQNDMDEEGRLVYDSNIRIKNDFTLWFLKKTGFEWNETDMEYIRGYVEYFRQIGYLEV